MLLRTFIFRASASTSASSARLEDHLIKTWVDGLRTATNLYQDTYTRDTGCPEIFLWELSNPRHSDGADT